MCNESRLVNKIHVRTYKLAKANQGFFGALIFVLSHKSQCCVNHNDKSPRALVARQYFCRLRLTYNTAVGFSRTFSNFFVIKFMLFKHFDKKNYSTILM